MLGFDDARIKRFVLWPTLIVFNALGLLLIWTAINQFLTASSSRSWPTVQGKVLSVQVVKQERLTLPKSGERGPRYVYYPEIQYRYTVGGAEYQGHRITADDVATNNPRLAERIARQYAAGQAVTVHYNPDDPREALLQAGQSGGALATLVMGVLFVIAPTAMVLFVGGSGRSAISNAMLGRRLVEENLVGSSEAEAGAGAVV